jgi:hypothetical protein
MIMRPEILQTIQDYTNHGIHPGNFLAAVFSNNLMDACAFADEDNQRDLPKICKFLYEQIPQACYGSRERYDLWREHQGLEGIKESFKSHAITNI